MIVRRTRLELGALVCDMSGMDKNAVIDKLRAHQDALRAEGIAHMFLFGSVARGEAGPNSDVDLFYDHDAPKFSLIDVVRVQERLSDLLGARVDAMTRNSVHPRIRHRVEAEAVQVF